jgi:hypothetical protein
LLRSWSDIPRALCNQKTGQTFSVEEREFELLKQCNGKTDLNDKNSDRLARKSVIKKCRKNDLILDKQLLQIYNCRYVKKLIGRLKGGTLKLGSNLNESGNTTNVTVSVNFYRTNSGYETYGTGSVYCKINGTTYSQSVSSSQKITNSGITLFSKTLDIAHNSDGSKTLTCSAWISQDTPLSSSEQSYSQSLSTIPRASTFSGGSGNIGETTKITINRASSLFTHDLYYQFGSEDWVLIALNVETSSAGTGNSKDSP